MIAHRTSRLAACAALGLWAFAPASAWAEGSTSVAYQVDVAHDGHLVFDDGFKAPFKLKWARDLGSNVSYPIVAGGKAFVTAVHLGQKFGTDIYAFDLRTGHTTWQRFIKDKEDWNSTLAYEDGMMFDLNADGLLRSIDIENKGKPVWTTQLKHQHVFHSPPIAVGGQVFVDGIGADGTFYAVDQKTGTVNWTQPVAGGGISSPTFGGGAVHGSYSCQVYKLDPGNGATIWHWNHDCLGGGTKTAVYFEGRLYDRDPPAGNVVFDDNDGAVVGSFASITAPVFWKNAGGKTYQIVLFDHALYEVDPVSGNVAWSFFTGETLTSAPLAVNDVIFEGTLNGTLYAIDAATGAQLWSTNVGARILPPDEHNGSLLTGFGGGDGTLIVVAEHKVLAFVQDSKKHRRAQAPIFRPAPSSPAKLGGSFARR